MRLALALLLGLAAPALAQPFHLEDSLRNGTMENATGGTFEAAPRWPSARSSRIS